MLRFYISCRFMKNQHKKYYFIFYFAVLSQIEIIKNINNCNEADWSSVNDNSNF